MQRVRIGDLCSYAKGLSIPRDRTNPDKDVAYLHYGDLYKKYDFRLNLDEVWDDIIKIDSNERYKPEQVLYDGDIVFTLTSESVDDLGHSALIINKNNLPLVSGMETTILHIIDKNRCLPSYLNYVFQSNWFRQVLRQYVTGMKVYRVHPRDLMNITLPLPDLSRQGEICNLLNPISDCIDVNTKINDYLAQLCTNEIKRLHNLCCDYTTVDHYCTNIFSGGTPSTSCEEYWNGTIPWLSSGETRSKFIIDTEKKITIEGVNNSSTKLAKCGDVVMASAGQGWTRGQTALLLSDMYVNQSILVMRPRNNCSAFLLFTLLGKYDEIRTWSDGSSSRGSMSGQLLREFPIELVSEELLSEFEKFCKPIITMIEIKMKEIRSLSEMRGLLISRVSQEIDTAK